MPRRKKLSSDVVKVNDLTINAVDTHIDWVVVKRNNRNALLANLWSRKTITFIVGILILIALIIVAVLTGEYEKIGIFIALVIGAGFTPISAVFLASVYKD